MVAALEQAIRERAYQLWVEGGRQEGTSDHHWAQAETEIRAAVTPTERTNPTNAGRAKSQSARAAPRADATSPPRAGASRSRQSGTAAPGLKGEMPPAPAKAPSGKAPSGKAPAGNAPVTKVRATKVSSIKSDAKA